MTTALSVVQRSLVLWHSVHGDESLDQQCQRQAGYYFLWALLNTEAGIVGYTTAKLAALASPIAGHDINSAPVGAWLYWSIGTDWHVGNVVGHDGGRVLVAFATTKGDTVLSLGYGVKVAHADTYPATFYGWSYTNGRNVRADGLTDYQNAPLTPTQRQAVALGANARVGSPSATAAIDTANSILGGIVGNFDGWRHGDPVAGNDVWFHGAIHGDWYWSGGFTDTGTHDLADMNPVVPAGAKRIVLASSPANIRPEPNTQKGSVGSVAAASTITMTGFAHGQSVSNANVPLGTDLWYTDADLSVPDVTKYDWYWAGAFTSITTDSLKDLTSLVAPPPAAIVMRSFGIDVNGDKAAIDFVKAKADGVDFAIIKAGGHNTMARYAVAQYPGMVDRVRTAGLLKGHYYVSGAGTIADEADYFISILHGFDLDADVLMLDNELFGHGASGTDNMNSALWDDTQVAEFFTRLHEKLGIPYSRLVHYFNEVTYEQGPGYPKTEALGVQSGPANYYSNPTARVAQNAPALKTWWATQFSSQQTVGGFGPVDGWWSDKTAAELFAKGDVVAPPDPGGGTTPPDSGDTAPNWFVQLITAIVNAIKSWLGGQKQ